MLPSNVSEGGLIQLLRVDAEWCVQLMAGGKLKLSRRAVLLDDGGVAPRDPSMSPSRSIRTPPASPRTPTAMPAAVPEVGRLYRCASSCASFDYSFDADRGCKFAGISDRKNPASDLLCEHKNC